MEKSFDLGEGIQYDNWGYGVSDEIITTLSGDPPRRTTLKNSIFEPLKMSRITTNESKLENRTQPYQALSDFTPHILDSRPQFEDGQIMQGAVGVESCVRD